MPSYTVTTWVNGVTPANAANLNKIETQLAAAPYSTFFSTPFLLVNNATINAGTTNTYTATGGSTGVTSGSKAVLVAVTANATNTGNYLQFAPHGGTLGQYAALGNFTVTGVSGSMNQAFILPVDASGQIDIKSNGTGSCTLSVYIYGYIY